MKYSVIIPHYSTDGDTKLLRRAISSIPRRDDIEIIVVDNSPFPITFDTYPKTANFHLLKSDPTKGAGHARNIGIINAKGKWILFLDADDFYIHNAFECFDSFSDKQYDIVFSKFSSVYSDTLEPADRAFYFNKFIDNFLKNGSEESLRYDFATPCGKMFKSSFLRKYNISFEEIHASNDVLFSVTSGYYAKTIAVADYVTYCATVCKGSLTNVLSKRNFLDRFGARMRLNTFLQNKGISPRASVMWYVCNSYKYGCKTFFIVLWKSIKTGYILVGYKRWLRTVLYVIKDNKKNQKKKYIINC